MYFSFASISTFVCPATVFNNRLPSLAILRIEEHCRDFQTLRVRERWLHNSMKIKLPSSRQARDTSNQTARIFWLINEDWHFIEIRQEAFLLYDQRGDGKIPVSQIGDVMRALGQVEFNNTPRVVIINIIARSTPTPPVSQYCQYIEFLKHNFHKFSITRDP